jgi:hypothetical protein
LPRWRSCRRPRAARRTRARRRHPTSRRWSRFRGGCAAFHIPQRSDEAARGSVTVTPQVAGASLNGTSGRSQLKMGQLLFDRPRPYQAQLDATRAQLAQPRGPESALTQLKMYESITDVRAVSALDSKPRRTASRWTGRKSGGGSGRERQAQPRLLSIADRRPRGRARRPGRRRAGEDDAAPSFSASIPSTPTSRSRRRSPERAG